MTSSTPPTPTTTSSGTSAGMHPEAVLASLGLTLPPPPKVAGAYVPFRRTGSLVFVAGQIPMENGQLIHKGAVPDEVTVEQAQACAARCVLNGLAVVKSAVGDLAKVKQVVRVGVFVCSRAGFYDQPKVANGASELLMKVFGEKGQHARAAVGNIALPLGAPVEVEFVFEVE